MTPYQKCCYIVTCSQLSSQCLLVSKFLWHGVIPTSDLYMHIYILKNSLCSYTNALHIPPALERTQFLKLHFLAIIALIFAGVSSNDCLLLHMDHIYYLTLLILSCTISCNHTVDVRKNVCVLMGLVQGM